MVRAAATHEGAGRHRGELDAVHAAAVLALAGLLAEATALATTARRAGIVDARPPAPLLAIDQGEELFASENMAESERSLKLLAYVFNDLPENVDPYVLVTTRAGIPTPRR